MLFAARHILLDCFGRLDDSRTGEDAISWMLQARAYLFFSPYLHTVNQNQLYTWVLLVVKTSKACEQLVESKLFVCHGMLLAYKMSVR